jgi:hypothetical protein
MLSVLVFPIGKFLGASDYANLITAWATIVLAIITGYYAKFLHDQTVQSERQFRKKSIIHLSMSVFTPIQYVLKEATEKLRDQMLFSEIKNEQWNLPSFKKFLKGNYIYLISPDVIPLVIKDASRVRRLPIDEMRVELTNTLQTVSAKRLLSISDFELEKQIPPLMELCKEYHVMKDEFKRIHRNFQHIYPDFLTNYGNYVTELNRDDQIGFEMDDGSRIMHYLFTGNFDNGSSTALKMFIQRKNGFINEWCNSYPELKEWYLKKIELLTKIKEINYLIEKMQIQWKTDYGLGDDDLTPPIVVTSSIMRISFYQRD